MRRVGIASLGNSCNAKTCDELGPGDTCGTQHTVGKGTNASRLRPGRLPQRRDDHKSERAHHQCEKNSCVITARMPNERLHKKRPQKRGQPRGRKEDAEQRSKITLTENSINMLGTSAMRIP